MAAPSGDAELGSQPGTSRSPTPAGSEASWDMLSSAEQTAAADLVASTEVVRTFSTYFQNMALDFNDSCYA